TSELLRPIDAGAALGRLNLELATEELCCRLEEDGRHVACVTHRCEPLRLRLHEVLELHIGEIECTMTCCPDEAVNDVLKRVRQRNLLAIVLLVQVGSSTQLCVEH